MGSPLPWYTYPAIDFLSQRDFSTRKVLEFGGGQSTLWWASRAESVLTVEEDRDWYANLAARKPENVELHHIPVNHETRSIEQVRCLLDKLDPTNFDVIIIDGHLRKELVELSFEYLSPGGAIICDNAEGYGFYDALKSRECSRIDLFGFAPGVLRRHCTALVWVDYCFLMDNSTPIATIEKTE
jgi:predicted O-methyltransferase YrrM